MRKCYFSQMYKIIMIKIKYKNYLIIINSEVTIEPNLFIGTFDIYYYIFNCLKSFIVKDLIKVKVNFHSTINYL
jgi:hypothetical protein